MKNIHSLFSIIFFGDFGLLTTTPKYLLFYLLPVITGLQLLGWLLSKIPIVKSGSPTATLLYYLLPGLGCKTVALVSAGSISSHALKEKIILILVFLIPCSAQLALITTFFSLVSDNVVLPFFFLSSALLIILVLILAALVKTFISGNSLSISSAEVEWVSLKAAIKNSIYFVADTGKAFVIGSVVLSLLTWSGILERANLMLSSLMWNLFSLPESCGSLLILNLIKRDFGSASLQSLFSSSCISSCQGLVLMCLFLFTTPCFNSTIVLFKEEKLPVALCIWLGSLIISIIFGILTNKLFIRLI